MGLVTLLNRAVKRRRGGEWVGGGAPAWTPADLSGLQLWMDAADAATITDAGGGAVSQWVDKASSLAFTQGTGGNRPTLVPNAYNGLPTVRFDGADWLATGTNGLLRNAPCASLALVAMNTDRTRVGVALNVSVGTGSSARFVAAALGTAQSFRRRLLYRQADGASSSFVYGTPWVDDVLQIETSELNVAADHVLWWDDGAFTGFEALPSSPANFANTDSTGATIGAAADSWGGDICEIVLVPRVLTTVERGNLEGYLLAKWGI